MRTGRVIFSLDFELGWGHRLTRPSYVEDLRSEGDKIRHNIKELMDLFENYNIPATWAVVGKLVESGTDDLFHAPDLFEYLLDSEVEHEIGLHSYAHEPYEELSPTEAQEDLQEGIDSLREWGYRPESFVFPQNKIAHLDFLHNEGFKNYRGAQPSALSSFPWGLLTPKTFAVPDTVQPPVRIPSSMFLATRRPSTYRRRYALRGLSRAMDRKELVHYWVHPHNIVTDKSLLAEMETLLNRTRSALDKGKIQIQTMAQEVNHYQT